jgi:SAM-dependent methyltransferase
VETLQTLTSEVGPLILNQPWLSALFAVVGGVPLIAIVALTADSLLTELGHQIRGVRMRTNGMACPCCGSSAGTNFTPVMWRELGEEWGLSGDEYDYIDRQQGECCVGCGMSLRVQAYAKAILTALDANGPFKTFARSLRGRMLRIMEINSSQLTPLFPRGSRHELRTYPGLDMTNMTRVADDSYDLVIHSDTLEHVRDPDRALRECLRVLKPGGACVYTVPIVVGRLTRSRAGMPPSHHGKAVENRSRDDYLVHTEYGADAWVQVLDAGFDECRLVAVKPPCAYAVIGIKRAR